MRCSGVPPPPTPVPARILELAGDQRLTPVWLNELGGLTYRTHDRFLKWSPAAPGIDLTDEAERLVWAGSHMPVPRVLEAGVGTDESWLVTAAMPGESAVSDRWKARPDVAAAAIGTGLRAMHDRLPVETCPYGWGIDERLGAVSAEVREIFADPEPDRLVVCHGDACAPNTLIGDDGGWVGNVDLGSLGVADRWADLAVATRNLGLNFGPGLEPVLLAAYGVEPDPVRTEFYQRLWDFS